MPEALCDTSVISKKRQRKDNKMESSAIHGSTIKAVIIQYALRAMKYLEWFFSKNVRMFELCGIEFSLNGSAILLPATFFASCGLNWFTVGLVLAVASSLLIHEIGHAIGGYVVGNHAKEISLIACGGYTILTRLPGATAKDAIISAFGPLANALVVIAMVFLETLIFGLAPWKWICILIYQMFGDGPNMDFMPSFFHIMNTLTIINTYMFLFNLIPAFPLDGGRVFRVIVGRFMAPITAAKVTMFVSRACACMIVIHAVIPDVVRDWDPFDSCFLIVVAAWIWFGSMAEIWRTENDLWIANTKQHQQGVKQ